MEPLLQTFGLTKKYGNTTVVDNVGITVGKGDIYGLIGKNGAGKTTLMKMILGTAIPTEGNIKYSYQNGLDNYKQKIGSIIEHPSIYNNFSAWENMKRYSIIFGSSNDEIKDILNSVGLRKEVLNNKVGTFSLGMKQRLGIAIALLGNPHFLILDEPINGLDPAGIVEIRDLILNLNKEKNITFMISSHLLDELSKIATKYAIISDGKLIEELTAKELQKLCKKSLLLHVDDVEKSLAIISTFTDKNDIQVNNDSNHIEIDSKYIDIGKLNRQLNMNGIMVDRIEVKEQSLENYFFERVGK